METKNKTNFVVPSIFWLEFKSASRGRQVNEKKTPSTPLTLDWPRLSGSYCVIFLRESLRPFPLKKKPTPKNRPKLPPWKVEHRKSGDWKHFLKNLIFL